VKTEQKKIDPNKLKPGALVKLMNGTEVGKVTTTQTIASWHNAGMPRNPDGKTYSLLTVIAWLTQERSSGRGKQDKSGDNAELNELIKEKLRVDIEFGKIKIEHEHVKKELSSLKEKIGSGELMERDKHLAALMDRARFVRESIESISSYASRLQGRNLSEIRAGLTEIGKDILRLMAAKDDD